MAVLDLEEGKPLKLVLKRLIAPILRNRIVWFILSHSLGCVASLYSKLERMRQWRLADELQRTSEDEQFAKKCSIIFKNATVLNGPFRGMKYPALRAFGSALHPKLLGSYEHELHSAITAFFARSYHAIVDIGCAEGYYAVGFGRQFPNATIYAFDVSPDAIRWCQEMATANGVQVTTRGFCDQNALTNLELGHRSLIISDCEGYENVLFDEKIASRMARHDFLIETHDFIHLNTTNDILSAFSKTHDCEVIESVDDIIKAYRSNYTELADFTLKERLRILSEHRPTIMRWVVATTRSTANK